jgi:hypothetical protein
MVEGIPKSWISRYVGALAHDETEPGQVEIPIETSERLTLELDTARNSIHAVFTRTFEPSSFMVKPCEAAVGATVDHPVCVPCPTSVVYTLVAEAMVVVPELPSEYSTVSMWRGVAGSAKKAE